MKKHHNHITPLAHKETNKGGKTQWQKNYGSIIKKFKQKK
jgi:hypothetical protein